MSNTCISLTTHFHHSLCDMETAVEEHIALFLCTKHDKDASHPCAWVLGPEEFRKTVGNTWHNWPTSSHNTLCTWHAFGEIIRLHFSQSQQLGIVRQGPAPDTSPTANPPTAVSLRVICRPQECGGPSLHWAVAPKIENRDTHFIWKVWKKTQHSYQKLNPSHPVHN
jgi:hypothetical protein